VAVARKLGIQLWIMLRDQIAYNGSVVVDRSSRKAAMPVWGCQKRRMVRKVTGRLIGLPASLEDEGVRIPHHGRW
jgi:hypothetical protein